MYATKMVTFTMNIPQMLAYTPASWILWEMGSKNGSVLPTFEGTWGNPPLYPWRSLPQAAREQSAASHPHCSPGKGRVDVEVMGNLAQPKSEFM